MAEKAEELEVQVAEEEEEEIEIELVDLQEIAEKEKRLYDTALSAHERKNYAYGIDLLRTLLKKYPGLIEARMKLREIQMDRIGKISALSQALATVGAILPYLKVKRLAAKGNYAEALDAGEAAMGLDPTACFPCIVLFRAAEAADVDAICLMALEQAIEFHPKSLQVLDWLAQLYSRMGMGKKALVCRQKIFETRPNDLQAEALVKDAIAEAAMDEGGWERVAESDGKLDYRSLIKDTSEAVRLEQQDRTVKGDAATELIDDLMSQIAEQDTIDRRKKVAELYLGSSDFENALVHYERAQELSDGADPSIEAAMTAIYGRQYDAAVREWEAYVKSEEITDEQRQEGEAQVAELKQQKLAMFLQRYAERVKRYPNDVPERFKFATFLWEDGQIDEALPHFQVTQRNARFKQESTIYLGRCFASKGQHDLAIDQYQTGIAELEVMNAVKKDALYSLAKSLEEVGRTDEALDQYKEIYAADLSYRDVADIITRSYDSDSD